MTLLEQLQEKHLKAIMKVNFAETSFEKGIMPASDACTQITLQAIVEVLEGCMEFKTDSRVVADVLLKIEELKLLIKK